MNKCKFCGKIQNRPLSKGYCVSCYQYFIMKENKIFPKSQYGELDRVTDKNDKQYGQPICHICGKAYTKLQQHIHYSHNMTKQEYCDKFGIDRGINMTTDVYNKKMSNYAYKYNMDEQLRKVGVNTRFKKGYNNNYKRSEMTMKRLKQSSFIKSNK